MRQNQSISLKKMAFLDHFQILLFIFSLSTDSLSSKNQQTCLNCQNPDILEQTVLAAMFYFEYIFVFCWSINKNVLELFLLIICKENSLTRSTNLFGRNDLTLCF